VAGLRCGVAVAPLLLMTRKYRGIKIRREDYKYFFCVGSLGYFLTICLIQEGISRTGASMASLINSLTPVGVTICAALLLKEKITPVKIFCLFLAVAGTWVITSNVTAQGELLGIFMVLCSIVSWSFASVFMRRLTATYPAIMVTAYGMLFSLVFHVPVSVYTVIREGGVAFTPKSVAVILYLGLIGSCLAQFSWTASLARIPASTCALFYPLQPTFSAILGALILKETFAPTFFIGMVLIGADVILSALETRRLSRQAEKEKMGAVTENH